MRANSRGDLVGCVGGQPLWVWRRQDAKPLMLTDPSGRQAIGGDGQWLTDNTAIALTDGGILAWDLSSDAPRPYVFASRQANRLRAADGVWLATTQTARVPWSTIGSFAVESDWGINDMARPGQDGACVLQSHLTPAWRVCDRTGAIRWSFSNVPFAICASGYVMMRLGSLVHLFRSSDGAEVPMQRIGAQQWPGPAVVAPDGRLWVGYESDTKGFVLHPADDASHGYVLGTPCFSPLVHFEADGKAMLAWATGEGEVVAQLVRREVTFGENTVPLGGAPPTVVVQAPVTPIPPAITPFLERMPDLWK